MKSDIAAFEMYDGVYFVGSTKVSVHLIRSSEGLVMIDTGYPNMYEQILDSMAELGLDPKDICAIFHSHGHIDHFGCTRQFRKLSGAKTYIGRPDNDIVNGTYDLSWAKELGLERIPPFDCDVLVDDGDVFTFGDVTVRCRYAPGHTAGVLALFVEVNGIVAAMHGGVGMNSLSREFLEAYGLPLSYRDDFRAALHALADEHVDLQLGNHPGHNNTQAKLKHVLAGESVLNPNVWREFLKYTEERLDTMLAKEATV